MSIPLPVLEAIIEASGIAPRIEALLPAGVRHRQLKASTLILGMMLAQAGRRPAHLTEVHAALTALPPGDQARLGVTEGWKTGPHQLTYRQAERTFGLITKALRKEEPDGSPSAALATVLDDLLEASIPDQYKAASASLAADWTDVESFSRPPHHGSSDCADPEASWGHRNSNLPGPKGEMFFGYYLSAATMTRDEDGPPVPELTRRITLSSCHADPVRALAPVLTRMPGNGIPLGDILADSGYAHRDADAWALPLRAAGAQLVQDLHPADRGPQGTCHGAIITNGNLYCPATPQPLLHLGPLPPAAIPEDTAAHDIRTAEFARHKLGRLTADDADGYHRVTCPAVMGKLRCPLRPASMTLDRSRPEILTPPACPPTCCTQQTLTIPPSVAAKTRQKHDYPSAAHRRSYTRRTAAERGFSTIKDPASNTVTRGWCRLMGPTPLAFWLAALHAIRNQRILAAWNTRQADNQRRAAAGLPPRTRKRRRKTTLASLTAPP
ncbi:MAG: hypothetical protein ACLQDY_22510 [Streptosporangiaceae bacterium]